MARQKKFSDPVDIEIVEVHRRFIEVMEEIRIEMIEPEMKRRYLAIMKSLTDKLAIPSKPLHEVVGELMAEAGPILFQVMSR